MTLFQERKMLLGILMVLSMKLDTADGHAKMIEPPMRSSMWRFGFDTPINYNDNELFCGGIEVSFFLSFFLCFFFLSAFQPFHHSKV